MHKFEGVFARLLMVTTFVEMAISKFRMTFDRLMVAITFAEANEHERALDIIHDRPEREIRKRVDPHIRRSEEARPQMHV